MRHSLNSTQRTCLEVDRTSLSQGKMVLSISAGEVRTQLGTIKVGEAVPKGLPPQSAQTSANLFQWSYSLDISPEGRSSPKGRRSWEYTLVSPKFICKSTSAQSTTLLASHSCSVPCKRAIIGQSKFTLTKHRSHPQSAGTALCSMSQHQRGGTRN